MLTPIHHATARSTPSRIRSVNTREGSTSFQVEPPSGPHGIMDTAAVETGGGVMVPPMDDAATERNRRGHVKALALLDALDHTRNTLLGAGDRLGAVASLARLAASMPEVSDPRLSALVGLVTLRARIEAWRLGNGG